jgi:hypothetical protein
MSRRWSPGDAENTSFELPEEVIEKMKPGLLIDRETGGDDDDNHRFKRSSRKDVPKETLAERIRKAAH